MRAFDEGAGEEAEMRGRTRTKGAAKSARYAARRGRRGTVGLGALALAACGGEQLPTGAELTISPAARSIEIVEYRDASGACAFDPNLFVDLPVVMRLVGGDGSPIGDAEVSVYVDFAANTWSGYPPLALFDDANGNGVVDADAELASGADDDVARVRTGRTSGARAMLLRANVSCPYRGEVFAYAGGATAQASIEIVARETIRPETGPDARPERLDDEGAPGADVGAEPDDAPAADAAPDGQGATETGEGVGGDVEGNAAEAGTQAPHEPEPEAEPAPFDLAPEPAGSTPGNAAPGCAQARTATPGRDCVPATEDAR